jgi:CRP-like cAMP-binding protein
MGVDVSIFRDALPYRGFRSGDWELLSRVMVEVRLEPGEVLFREGEEGDGFYLIRCGHVTIRRRVKDDETGPERIQRLAVLDSGQICGEMALLDGDRRSAEAATEDGAALFHLTGRAYADLKARHPATALRLQDLMAATLCSRLRAANNSSRIGGIPMPIDTSVFRDALPYRDFKPDDWKNLGGALVEVKVGKGHSLFREGDPGDGMYFIRSGHVRILRRVQVEGRSETQEQLLTVLDAGGIFGEMALIDGDNRSADAVPEEGAVLYHLRGPAYDILKREHPVTALRLQDLLVVTLCSRLRAANKSFEIIKFWLT